LVSFQESLGIGQAVIVGLHPVTGHIQMLTGIMVDIMQSIHEVRHIVSHRLLLVAGSPEQQVTEQK
jgi:hypothetical protein